MRSELMEIWKIIVFWNIYIRVFRLVFQSCTVTVNLHLVAWYLYVYVISHTRSASYSLQDFLGNCIVNLWMNAQQWKAYLQLILSIMTSRRTTYYLRNSLDKIVWVIGGCCLVERMLLPGGFKAGFPIPQCVCMPYCTYVLIAMSV